MRATIHLMMTSNFITAIFTIFSQITQLNLTNTFPHSRTLELDNRITQTSRRFIMTKCVIILIGPITAIVNRIANLILRNTLMIRTTLEPFNRITIEIITQFGTLVGTIETIIHTVTQVRLADT